MLPRLKQKLKNHFYFVKDVYEYFSQRKNPYVVFLDGYEKLVSLLNDGERSKFSDGWMSNSESGLVNIPNVLWVIGGREKLEWDTSILPPNHLYRTGDLSKEDTVLYFEKAGIDENLRVPLYKLKPFIHFICT